MKFAKRQLIIGALVVALGAAVYLNWQFSSQDKLVNEASASASDTEKEIGEAKYVNTKAPSEKDSTSSDNSSKKSNAESTAAEGKTAEEYFADQQLKRKQVQDEEVDLLKEIMEDASKSDAAKAEAVKQAAEIAGRIEQQNNIEGLIKAKGFNNCIAFIQNGECSIVIEKGKVTDASAITIKDIVHGQSGIDFEKIKIAEIG